jgi:ribulose-5-phosphate 4-epimerase/fuculose-1-phosphate aldolase
MSDERIMRGVEMPSARSLAEERTHRKQMVAAGLRLFSQFGFDVGAAGHITARDPELSDHFWVNPFGVPFSELRASDLLLVAHDGTVVEGELPVNAAAFAIHSQIHAARTDVVAAAHSHSLHGKAFSALAELLEPISLDACAFYEDHVVFDDFTGAVLDIEEGKRIAHALGDRKAAILRNHGLLTVGQTVESAIWWFVIMDQSCQAQLLAKAAGKPVHVEHDHARLTCEQVGTERVGWLQFQPLFRRIVREQPELLD